MKAQLSALSCSLDIPVRTYSYYDGNILAKYRVEIQLPEELGRSIVMPIGEAQSSALAYDLALVRAITTLRFYKSKELEGTIFKIIRFGDMEDRVTCDYKALVTRYPRKDASCLEGSMDLTSKFFDLYENLTTEVTRVLDTYTEPESVVNRRIMFDAKGEKAKCGFSLYPLGKSDLVLEPIDYSPETPPDSPTNPHSLNILRTGLHLNAYGWEIPDEYAPIAFPEVEVNEEVEESEVLDEFYLICHEEIEGLEFADEIEFKVTYDGTSMMCYYSNPPIGIENKELGMLRVDSSGNMHISRKDESPEVISASQQLESQTKTLSADPVIEPPKDVNLPDTVRRSDGKMPEQHSEEE